MVSKPGDNILNRLSEFIKTRKELDQQRTSVLAQEQELTLPLTRSFAFQRRQQIEFQISALKTEIDTLCSANVFLRFYANKFEDSKQIDDEESFRAWIEKNTFIQGRAIGDVCSRVRRATLMMRSDESSIELDSNPIYLQCTMSVKSQLKRAMHLYYLFQISRKT